MISYLNGKWLKDTYHFLWEIVIDKFIELLRDIFRYFNIASLEVILILQFKEGWYVLLGLFWGNYVKNIIYYDNSAILVYMIYNKIRIWSERSLYYEWFGNV